MNDSMKLVIPNFKFIRPGGIGVLGRKLDPQAQKQMYAFKTYLDEIKLPTTIQTQLEHNKLIADFFKAQDPDLESDFNKQLKSELKKLPPDAKLKSIPDFIDAKGHASLYYEVQKMIKDDKLSFNAHALLYNESIATYLFARAIFSPSLELTDASAIYKNMKDEDSKNGGIKTVYNFIVYNATIQIKQENKIETAGDKNSDTANKIVNGPKLSFTEGVFSVQILSALKQQVFNKSEIRLIEDNKDKLNISDDDIPYLVSYIKKSNIKIDTDNAEFYLAIALSNLKNNNLSYSPDKEDEIQDFDFSVKYYDDVKSSQTFSKESVLCAAQLYYVMTLGDELGVFEVINTIITKEMPSGRVDIVSKQLMKDLQQYFFNETFTIGNDSTPYRRTLPEERHMFYKQAFNAGAGEVIDGTSVNKEFDTCMNTLFEEVIKYIEKVERSNSASTMISRQNLYQAIEDLQYNLSSYCTGMIKVATPIINRELDFVVERFLMNDDIRKQLAPNGNGSFWKVIENVQRGKGKNSTSLLRNKAVFTHQILTSVANYNPVTFENESVISEFVSIVEALIINNSQLEDRHQLNGNNSEYNDLRGQHWDHTGDDVDMAGMPGSNGNGVKDEWNF